MDNVSIIFTDLLYNISIAIVVSILAWLAKKFWSYISKPTSTNVANPKFDLEKTKHQFYCSGLIFIVSTVTTFTVDSDFAKTFFSILAFFFLILVWGAFDALYNFIKEADNHNS